MTHVLPWLFGLIPPPIGSLVSLLQARCEKKTSNPEHRTDQAALGQQHYWLLPGMQSRQLLTMLPRKSIRGLHLSSACCDAADVAAVWLHFLFCLVKAPYNDALYTDNRFTTTKIPKRLVCTANSLLTTATTPDTTTSRIGKVSLYSNLPLAAKRACRPFLLRLGASNCVKLAT